LALQLSAEHSFELAPLRDVLGRQQGDGATRTAHPPGAAERADVRVLALRTSKHGRVGEPAPVHPHLFRHARVRQIVRTTKNLPLAQRQAGWSRLQPAYLSIGDEEARTLMRSVGD